VFVEGYPQWALRISRFAFSAKLGMSVRSDACHVTVARMNNLGRSSILARDTERCFQEPISKIDSNPYHAEYGLSRVVVNISRHLFTLHPYWLFHNNSLSLNLKSPFYMYRGISCLLHLFQVCRDHRSSCRLPWIASLRLILR
jgi:hypothetical protein